MRSLIAVALLAIGAGSAAEAQYRPAAPVERTGRLTPVPLPEIGHPAFFTGTAEQLVLIDYGDMTVHAADAEGRWTHVYRRRGDGPGELRTIGGVQFDGAGAIWIADRANARLSVRAPDLTVEREFRLEHPVDRLAPGLRGGRLLALPSSVREIAVLLSSDGRPIRSIPFPASLESLNPIARERYLVRIADSLSVVQFRWLDHRIAFDADGAIRSESRGSGEPPEVIAFAVDQRGSMGYRISPTAKEFALAVAARGDTLLVVRGDRREELHGRVIERYLAATGRLLDRLVLPVAVLQIAATRAGVFVIAETDDGYGMYLVR